MRNLKVLAFYNLSEQLLGDAEQTALENGVYHLGSAQKLEAFVLTNCRLQARAKSLLEVLGECQQIKLLVLQNLELQNEKEVALMLQKHRERRDQEFFAKSLRDPQLEGFGTSKSKSLNPCEVKQLRLRKETAGLQFLDLSMNMNPKLCDAVCEALEEDKYISYVNLEGNCIDIRQKVLRKTDYVVKMNNCGLLENVQSVRQIKKVVPLSRETYLPIYLCSQINAIEQSKKQLDPYEQTMLKKTVMNYQNLKGLQTVQLLQCYADDQAELAELMQMKQHPVVKLLLKNYYILFFNIGQSSEILKNFVNQRLELNRQTLEECIKCNFSQIFDKNLPLSDLSIEDSQIPKDQFQRPKSNLQRPQSTKLNQNYLQKDKNQEDFEKSLKFGLKSPQKLVENIQNGTRIRGQSVSRCSSAKKDFVKRGLEQKIADLDQNLIKVGEKGNLTKFGEENDSIEQQKEQEIVWQPIGFHKGVEKAKLENKKVFLYWDKQAVQKKGKHELVRLQKEIGEKTKELERLKDEQQRLRRAEVQQVGDYGENLVKNNIKVPTMQNQMVNSLNKQVLQVQNQVVVSNKLPVQQKNNQQKNGNEIGEEKDDLFNVILESAYELIMEKSGKNKMKALKLFNQNQDAILNKCEDIMNMVKNGQLSKNLIGSRLKQMTNIEQFE